MATIKEDVGDIFDSPPNSILIHACNTKGSWGAGVAAAFKKYSPAAFLYYKNHCNIPKPPSTSIANHQKSLVGTCLLIPPFPINKAPPGKPSARQPSSTPPQQEKKFWIACLFTSSGYGKNVDTPTAILHATESAIGDLRRQIEEELNVQTAEMGSCYGVRINSGLFGVPWRGTKTVLKNGGVDMVVVRPESQRDEVIDTDAEGEVGIREVHQKSTDMGQTDGADLSTEEQSKVSGTKAGIERADEGNVNKGLKRKGGQGGDDEGNGNKKSGGGRQTKLSFGRSQ
ncbi:MAG: hypothetical protein Q9169_006406 [Polycauliona sp. 2 TL-2023]